MRPTGLKKEGPNPSHEGKETGPKKEEIAHVSSPTRGGLEGIPSPPESRAGGSLECRELASDGDNRPREFRILPHRPPDSPHPVSLSPPQSEPPAPRSRPSDEAAPTASVPHVLHVFPTFVAGGAQVRTIQLMAAMGRDYRHSVLALDGRTSASELVSDEVALELLAPPEKAGSLQTIRRLRRILKATGPDLVCTYNWGAIDAVIAARLSGIRSVLHHEDGFGSDEANAFKRRRIWTRRLVLPGTAGLVVPSHTLESLALERWKLRAEEVHRIPNGIRVERFQRGGGNAALRSELGIPADARVIGSVGHLRAEKNPVRLIEAFAAVRTPQPPHLLILGDGSERSSVESRARALEVEDRVHLVGHRSAPEPYYRAMDVFAISSNTEQMPVALLEAMAAQLPVASTDVGDVRRILPDSQAKWVTALDSVALGRALEELCVDRETGESLGAANAARAREAFTFEAMVAAHRARFADALAR